MHHKWLAKEEEETIFIICESSNLVAFLSMDFFVHVLFEIANG
jgi:hypothetical protein